MTISTEMNWPTGIVSLGLVLLFFMRWIAFPYAELFGYALPWVLMVGAALLLFNPYAASRSGFSAAELWRAGAWAYVAIVVLGPLAEWAQAGFAIPYRLQYMAHSIGTLSAIVIICIMAHGLHKAPGLFVLAVVALVLSGSRSAMFMEIVGLFVLFWPKRREIPLWVVITSFALLAVSIVIASIGRDTIRLEMWGLAVRLWQEHSLTGAGFGAWSTAWHELYPASPFTDPHSIYLQVLAEFGAVGLLPLSAIMCGLLYLCRQRFAFAVLTGFFVQAAIDGIVFAPDVVGVVLLVIGMSFIPENSHE